MSQQERRLKSACTRGSGKGRVSHQSLLTLLLLLTRLQNDFPGPGMKLIQNNFKEGLLWGEAFCRKCRTECVLACENELMITGHHGVHRHLISYYVGRNGDGASGN
jgi:hypothetical protein